MIKSILLAGAALAMSASIASADAVGTWKTQAGKNGGYAIVKISKCGSQYCGRISSIHGNSNKSSVGKTIIKGMNRNGAKYSGGQVYAPDDNKWFAARMEETSGSRLKVAGCVAGGLICRTQTWTRQ